MGQEKWDEPIAAHLQTCFTAVVLFPVILLKWNRTFTLYTYVYFWCWKGSVPSSTTLWDADRRGDQNADLLIMRLLHLLSHCSFFINSYCGGKREKKVSSCETHSNPTLMNPALSYRCRGASGVWFQRRVWWSFTSLSLPVLSSLHCCLRWPQAMLLPCQTISSQHVFHTRFVFSGVFFFKFSYTSSSHSL